MKRVMILFLSLIAVLLMWGSGFSGSSSSNSTDYAETLRKMRAFEEDLQRTWKSISGEGSVSADWKEVHDEYVRLLRTISDIMKLEKEVQGIVKSCLAHNNDVIKLNVQYGRYITAFELCRKQGGGVDECIERIRKAKEEWRDSCREPYQSVRLFYYKELANAEKARLELRRWTVRENTCDRVPIYLRDSCRGAEGVMYVELNRWLSQAYPGSQFNLITGSGSIVLEDGVVYFQGWQFVQREFKMPGGLNVQIFPNKINLTSGAYNIAVVVGEEGKKWQIIEFNLPFDAGTEKQFVALNRGVRLTNKEIIQMVDEYLKNTVWEADLITTFKNLLLNGRERAFFMESLIEYYAFDNYIKMVKQMEGKQKESISNQISNQKSSVKKTGKRGGR
jgi:hypothetical protein